MKQAQNARKQRARSAPRKGGKSNGGNNRNNEPKIRGNPKQLLEKYKTQAREAKQAGDRVQAEYFYQFADHYQRVLNEMTAKSGGNQQSRDDREPAPEGGTDAAQDNRPRRGRRKRNPQENDSATQADNNVPDTEADPAASEQPVEVHPELDLNGTAATDEDSKPRRRRAPVQRRRTPRAKEEGEQAEAGPTQPAPEGNEAA